MTYFQAVCQYKTISRAAEAMHVSQPAVSNAVRELEDEFGIKLFGRRGNMLELTEAGALFLESCNQILADTDKLADLMRMYGNSYIPIKIGVPPMIAALVFPQLYISLAKRYPKISLEVFEQGSILSRKEVAQGSTDLAICIVDELDDSTLTIDKLFDTELVFCVGVDHPLANRHSIKWEEIAQQKIIMLKHDSYQYNALRVKFESFDLHPDVLLHSSQLVTINRFVEQGLGGAFFFKELADNNDRIVGIPIVDPITAQIGVVGKKSSRQVENLNKVIKVIKEIL